MMIENEKVNAQVSDKGNGASLIGKAAQHPFLTGGLIIAGAGLAYAVARAVQDDSGEVAREVHIETSIAIDKPASELYSFWRDFKNLPRFMRNLESVTETSGSRSHWIA